ncbi:MAG: glucuronate isomerase [Pirellulales bacterium]|nr:glucuronate isomerase [Pirellulales bacterium]
MAGRNPLVERLFSALDSLRLIDPHSHIDPHRPSASNLADILGYHYYTELAHSAGMPRAEIEDPQLGPKEKVERLVRGLGPLENTIQSSWLIEILQTFFGFQDERLTPDNWEAIYDASLASMQSPGWANRVLEQSGLEAVFLTNDFDDRLEGFDPRVYIPCLRTDELVFHLARPTVRRRLAESTGIEATNARELRAALAQRFEHFKRRGARACAISLPPDFVPEPVSDTAADATIAAVFAAGEAADAHRRRELAQFVFWTLADLCAEYRLSFDLMIGVNRAVYPGGVYQGQDLFDSRVSLIQYARLLNSFPQVTFPISVLASVTNQELVSYCWIFPNVVTSGHWWYSNIPSIIEHDLASRLEAVPQTKQIGYYSDMYKLEFGLPKFRMYKRVLAKVLAERFVIDRGWTEQRAVELGSTVLRGNVERVFFGETTAS